MGKECLMKLCRSVMGKLGKLSMDVSGAGDPLSSSSYPLGATHLRISNTYLILALEKVITVNSVHLGMLGRSKCLKQKACSQQDSLHTFLVWDLGQKPA